MVCFAASGVTGAVAVVELRDQQPLRLDPTLTGYPLP